MVEYKRITELEFGYEMLIWKTKGTYPLEAVSSIEFEDDNGIFFAPAIQNYVSGETQITGNGDGYKTREQLMKCVGRCWDKAEKEVAKTVKNYAYESTAG